MSSESIFSIYKEYINEQIQTTEETVELNKEDIKINIDIDLKHNDKNIILHTFAPKNIFYDKSKNKCIVYF